MYKESSTPVNVNETISEIRCWNGRTFLIPTLYRWLVILLSYVWTLNTFNFCPVCATLSLLTATPSQQVRYSWRISIQGGLYLMLHATMLHALNTTSIIKKAQQHLHFLRKSNNGQPPSAYCHIILLGDYGKCSLLLNHCLVWELYHHWTKKIMKSITWVPLPIPNSTRNTFSTSHMHCSPSCCMTDGSAASRL